MSDFLVAIGLVFAIEGFCSPPFPGRRSGRWRTSLETPDGALRLIGIVSAVVGVLLVWLVRGLIALP